MVPSPCGKQRPQGPGCAGGGGGSIGQWAVERVPRPAPVPLSRPTALAPSGRSRLETQVPVWVGVTSSFVVYWQTVCLVESLCWAEGTQDRDGPCLTQRPGHLIIRRKKGQIQEMKEAKTGGFNSHLSPPWQHSPRRAQPFGKEPEVGGHTPLWLDIVQIQKASELPWLPLVKTPCFYYRGHSFNPWSGNYFGTC